MVKLQTIDAKQQQDNIEINIYSKKKKIYKVVKDNIKANLTLFYPLQENR